MQFGNKTPGSTPYGQYGEHKSTPVWRHRVCGRTWRVWPPLWGGARLCPCHRLVPPALWGRLRTEKEKPYLDCAISLLISTSWESAGPGSIWRLARWGHFEFSAAAAPTVSLLSFSEQSRVSSELRHTPPGAGVRFSHPQRICGPSNSAPTWEAPQGPCRVPADTRCPGASLKGR